MWNNTVVSEKKKALLAHKERILEEIKYYEKRIEDERSRSKIEYYVDDFSSDSDDDFCIYIDQGHSLTQLKIEQSKLRTCLQATHELTSLQILQSEVNIIVNDPVITGEPPVRQPGTWREVTAECRIDLVPFSITFYTHKANVKFGPTSYRGLNVVLVKAAHEAELSTSVLPTLVRPSDAVEVLRSYAEAYRSRRSTLARLASKYADSLFMEPLAEGGYLLKCGNLLQVAWRLENKWSPLAPFHHRMKFDLEYMEEKYINIITQCHKQLSDPTISTDERSLLLSKIIATCLEANPVSESAESDQDVRMPKRRATLDQEIEEPENKKKKEIMAPPKSLPKKAKVLKTVSENNRPNDNSTRSRDVGDNHEGDKENEDNNVMGSTINAPAKNIDNPQSGPSGSKGGQKIAKKPSKVVPSNLAKDKNTENVVNAPKNNNKKSNGTAHNKNPDEEPDNVDKVIDIPQPSKKKVVKDKSKKVAKNNAVPDSNKKMTKDSVAAKNKADGEVDSVDNKKKQKDVSKNKANVAEGGKSSSKKINKVSEKIPEEGGTRDNASENVTSAKNTNAAKEPGKSKKLSKENTNTDNSKSAQSTGKGEKTVTKPTEKHQNTGSVQKAVERNSNNKIKDNIADIAKKTSKPKSVDIINDKMPIRRILHNSNDPIISQAVSYDVEDPEIRQAVTESHNVVTAKTKKNTDIHKVTDKTNVKNKMSTKKLSDKNEPTNKQITEKIDVASVKTKNCNIEKISNKKTISKDKTDKVDAIVKNKVIKNTINVVEKEKMTQKSKSQDNIPINIKKSDHTSKSVLPMRMPSHLKITRKSIGSIKASGAKENGGKVKSKIPQKKLSPLNENIMRKNPLRMSPRYLGSTLNSTSSLVKQSIQKSTSIPRLAKPMFKAK